MGNKKKIQKHTIDEKRLRARAVKEHEAIVMAAQRLDRSWLTLAQRLIAFRDKSYHRYIINPETSKPFASFDRWAKFVFGKSRSTLFSDISLVEQLKGEITDADVAATSKQNLKQLARLKKAGKQVTAEIIEDAKHMPAQEFRQEVIAPRLPTDQQRPEAFALGPYLVSSGVRDRFEQALQRAESLVIRGEQFRSKTEQALLLIATEFLGNHAGAEIHIPPENVGVSSASPRTSRVTSYERSKYPMVWRSCSERATSFISSSATRAFNSS